MIFCPGVIAYCEEKQIAYPTLSDLITRGMDPRISRIVPDSLAGKTLPSPILREVSTPTAPREVRLKNGIATVYPNIRMHPSSRTTQSEMSIAVNPIKSDEVLAGCNTVDLFLLSGSQGWYHTVNGGLNWEGSDTLPTHTDFSKYMSDPTVGINLNGYLLFNALLIGDTTYEVVIARSTNNGSSWSQVLVPSQTNGADKDQMAIDVNPGSPFRGYIYTAYTDFSFSPSPIMLSRSDNGGIKFLNPVPISGSVSSQFDQGVNLAVGPNGELYAIWSGYDAFPPVTTHIGFNKSTNGGVSWQGAFSIRDVFDIRGLLRKGSNSVRVNSFPSMAVDRSPGARRGWIYIVYAEKNPVTPDIFLVRSTDGGVTWSAPRKVNQDFSGRDQWFPWISVDPVTGHLYVVYYDSRNFPANDSAQVYVSSSIDGGGTFEDLLVSDAAFLPTPIPGLAFGYMGDYIGISALNGVVWPCWNDNRTGIHQAYTSRIVYLEIGSPPKISVSPDTLDFGEVFWGYPETLSVNIRNLAFPETLQVSGIASDNPDFTPAITNLAVPGGGAGKVKIAFNPSTPGPGGANLSIFSNDTANPVVSIHLQGAAVYPPSLRVSPDSFALDVPVGGSTIGIFTVADAGLGALTWRAAIFTNGGPNGGSFLSLHPDSGSVLPGEAATVELQANARQLEIGTYLAGILVISNDPAKPQDTIPVRLDVIPTPKIVLSGDSLDFGEVFVHYADTLNLTVFNRGSAPLEVNGMSFDNSRFSVLDSVPFGIAAGDSQKVRIQFIPDQVGLESGLLAITSTDPSRPVVQVPLQGIGIHAPVMVTSPDSIVFILNKGDSAAAVLTLAEAGQGILDFQITAVSSRVSAGRSGGLPLPTVAVAGFSARPLLDSLLVDSDLVARYELVNVGNDFGFSALRTCLGVVVSELPRGLTQTESDALNSYMNDGGAVVLGMDDLDDEPKRIRDALLDKFGLLSTYDGDFYFGSLNPNHPITRGIEKVGDLSPGQQNYFLPRQADWVVRGTDGNFYVTAYDGPSRRIFFGDQTYYWWVYSSRELVRNAINWAFESAWLSISSKKGILSPGGTREIGVKVRTDRLKEGDYRADILVSGNDPFNSQDTIPVRLTVAHCTVAKGDLNGDSLLTVADLVLDLNCIFLGEGGGTAGGTCNHCYTDSNCDGALEPADVVLELLAVFLNQPFPC